MKKLIAGATALILLAVVAWKRSRPLLLAVAIVAGYVARLLRVPRVVGYLLAGAFLNYVLHRLFDAPPGSQNHCYRRSFAGIHGRCFDCVLHDPVRSA